MKRLSIGAGRSAACWSQGAQEKACKPESTTRETSNLLLQSVRARRARQDHGTNTVQEGIR